MLVVDLSRNYQYGNDTRKIALQCHLSQYHLPLQSGQLNNEGCRLAWERPVAQTKVSAFMQLNV